MRLRLGGVASIRNRNLLPNRNRSSKRSEVGGRETLNAERSTLKLGEYGQSRLLRFVSHFDVER